MPTDKPEEEKSKISKKLEDLKASEKLESIYSYAQSSTRDTLAYVILITGLVLLFFHPFIGGSLIGLIGGLYFAKEITEFARSTQEFLEEYGMVRSLVFGGGLLGLFISAPAIFIGAAIAIGLKTILLPSA